MVDVTEALGWIGYRVDDVYGARVGVVEDVYADAQSSTPWWILAKIGRFTETHSLLPLQDAVAGTGHVWVPYEKDLIRRAPQIASGVPITQALEAALCSHYGVMSSRGAEIADLPGTAVSAASAQADAPMGSWPEARETGS